MTHKMAVCLGCQIFAESAVVVVFFFFCMSLASILNDCIDGNSPINLSTDLNSMAFDQMFGAQLKIMHDLQENALN